MMDKFRGVYTYGQPMIMSGESNLVPSLVEAVTYRHVFHQDPVPHLPPETTGYWRHFGSERRLEVGREDWTLCSEEKNYSEQILSILLAGAIGIIKFVSDQLRGIPGISFVDKYLSWNFNDLSPWGYVMCLAPEEHRGAAIPRETFEGSTASSDMVTSGAIGIMKFITESLSRWGYSLVNLVPEEQRDGTIPQKTYEGSTASKQGKDMVTSAADFIHGQ
jgi:hypothetical protein